MLKLKAVKIFTTILVQWLQGLIRYLMCLLKLNPFTTGELNNLTHCQAPWSRGGGGGGGGPGGAAAPSLFINIHLFLSLSPSTF